MFICLIDSALFCVFPDKFIGLFVRYKFFGGGRFSVKLREERGLSHENTG